MGGRDVPGFDVPADSAIILNFHLPTNPGTSARRGSTANDGAGCRPRARRVYIAVPAVTAHKNNIVVQAGFAYQGSIICRTRMGRLNIRLENVAKPAGAVKSTALVPSLPIFDFQPCEHGRAHPRRKTG